MELQRLQLLERAMLVVEGVAKDLDSILLSLKDINSNVSSMMDTRIQAVLSTLLPAALLKSRMPGAKDLADGSIQGHTGRRHGKPAKSATVAPSAAAASAVVTFKGKKRRSRLPKVSSPGPATEKKGRKMKNISFKSLDDPCDSSADSECPSTRSMYSEDDSVFGMGAKESTKRQLKESGQEDTDVTNDIELHNIVEKSTEGKEEKQKKCEGPFCCEYCGKICIDTNNLEIHRRVHTGEKPFQCLSCKKGFADKSTLRQHLKLHSGEKPFSCSICGKAFTLQSYVRRHMRNVHLEKPYKCLECDKAFIKISQRKRHMRTHTKEKPLKCSVCEKSFREHDTLNVHMRLHTGEKPFICSVCGRAFRQYTNLCRHMRFHSGEKPYKCLQCDKAFASSTQLNGHTRTHTKEKPYKCTVCDKSFSLRCTLVNHMRTHTGDRPFSCEECGRCFSQSGPLSRHKRLVHRTVSQDPNAADISNERGNHEDFPSEDQHFQEPAWTGVRLTEII